MEPFQSISPEENDNKADLKGSPLKVMTPDLPLVWKMYCLVPE